MENISRSDVKIILGRDSVVRRARSESALIKGVLGHNDPGRVYAQLKLILVAFERVYQRDKNIQPRVESFYWRLARACVQQNRLDLFLCAWRDAVLNGDNTVMDLPGGYQGGTTSSAQLERYAVTRFVVEAQRAFSQNGQVAAEFALALLERVHRTMTIMVDEYGTAYPEPDRWLELLKNPDAQAMVTMHRFVIGAFACPPESPEFPAKAWLERLYERADEPAIGAIILAISAFSRTASGAEGRTTIGFIRQADLGDCAYNAILDRYNGVKPRQRLVWQGREIRPPSLLLSERLMPLAQRFLKRENELADRQLDLGNRILAMFEIRREQMTDRVEQMREGIKSRPRRGLRPNGQDHIEIQISALNNAGIHGLIFHPEGCAFPDVGVEIVYNKETPHLRTYRTTMEGLKNLPWKDLYVSERHSGKEELLHGLLSYMAYDILHRIVTEDRPIREHPSRKGTSDTAGRVAVRPYMRKLPDGHRASLPALEAAKRELGYQPPQGMTFVQAFFRNDELEYDLPSEPFAIYGDEDIELEEAV